MNKAIANAWAQDQKIRAEYNQYLGKVVNWLDDIDEGEQEKETLDSVCFQGGFDKLDEPVFLNKDKDRWFTLDYVKQNLV